MAGESLDDKPSRPACFAFFSSIISAYRNKVKRKIVFGHKNGVGWMMRRNPDFSSWQSQLAFFVCPLGNENQASAFNSKCLSVVFRASEKQDSRSTGATRTFRVGKANSSCPELDAMRPTRVFRASEKQDSRPTGPTKKASPTGWSFLLEAQPGIGPGMRVLQTLALPLGYCAEKKEITEAKFTVASLISCFGADYGARTRHLDLGKVALYQMS